MHRRDAARGGSLTGAIRPKAKFALIGTSHSQAMCTQRQCSDFGSRGSDWRSVDIEGAVSGDGGHSSPVWTPQQFSHCSAPGRLQFA